MKVKMHEVFDYNTEEKIKFDVRCCWACHYADTIKDNYIKTQHNYKPVCDFCPLYPNMEKGKLFNSCVILGSIYTQWAEYNEDVENEIAQMIWRDYDAF